MIEINGKHLCENCFSESIGEFCRFCGYNASVTVSDPTMLRPGSILLGKYIIGKVIGKGGFGITYLAYDISSCKKVAIKEYFPYGVALRAAGNAAVSVANMENAEAFKMGAEKFYDEAKLVSRFNGNPNIVGVYEFFYENNTVYFVMEYLEGHTLKDHINNTGTLTAAQALFLIRNVSNALMAAHSSAVLHRDVSPDNIILCDNGDIKLIDFGAARQVVAEHSQSFSVILKPGFAPLEQYQKKGNQGPWTDIYSLGTTLYFAMTGDIPEDPMSRLDDDAVFSSNQFNIDPDLWDVIFKATQLKIDDRYADIFQLKNDLSKISYEAEPIVIPKEQPAEQKPEFPTAVPFGAAQANPQTAGAPNSANIAKTAYVQPIQSVQPQQSPKKNRKGLIIGISCGLVACIAAAIIIPNALKGRNNIPVSGDGSNTYSSSTSNGSPSVTQSSGGFPSITLPSGGSSSGTQPSGGDTLPAPGTIASIPSGRIYYETLDDPYKVLYETIYAGILNSRTEIYIPNGFNYDISVIEGIYYEVLYENPQFCYAFECEVDIIKGTVKPHFERVYYSDEQLKKAADKVLNTIDVSDKIGALIAVHDWLCENVSLTYRYNGFSTSAYNAIMGEATDDIGLSKAFCYFAQQLGFQCLVVDGTLNGDECSWNRICINNIWYNVDVYGDMTSVSYIQTLSVANVDKYIHSFFLTNDEFVKASGYALYTANNFLMNNYVTNSQYANYYFQAINDFRFHFAVDETYESILSFTVKSYNEGYTETYYAISPFIVDELYAKMNDEFIADLIKNGMNTDVKASVSYREDGMFYVTIK